MSECTRSNRCAALGFFECHKWLRCDTLVRGLLAEAMAMQRGLIAAAFAAACAVTIGVLSTRAVVRSNAKRLQVRSVDLLLASSCVI